MAASPSGSSTWLAQGKTSDELRADAAASHRGLTMVHAGPARSAGQASAVGA